MKTPPPLPASPPRTHGRAASPASDQPLPPGETAIWQALDQRDPASLNAFTGPEQMRQVLGALLHRHQCLSLMGALPPTSLLDRSPRFQLRWPQMGFLFQIGVTGPCEEGPMVALRGTHRPPCQARLGPLLLQTDGRGQVSLTVPPGISPLTVTRGAEIWAEVSGPRQHEIPLEADTYEISCGFGHWQIEISRLPPGGKVGVNH